MKKILLAGLCLIAFVSQSQAQNKTLGVGTTTPNANAALHVESPTNNQGVIFPRLTTAQRLAMNSVLTTADEGLVLYDKDLDDIYTWDGTQWMEDRLFESSDANATIKVVNNGTIGSDAAASAAVLAETTSAFSAITGRIPASASQANAISGITKSTDPGSWAGYFDALTGTAVYGTTASNVGGTLAPVGVYGESRGTGSVGGAFWINNPSNNYTALYANTTGTGSSLFTETSTGYASIHGNHTGANGIAGLFNIDNTGSTATAFRAETNGTGPAGNFVINNATSTAPALSLTHSGTGIALAVNQGGVKLTTADVTTATITTRASAYNINGGGITTYTFSLPNGLSNGEVFFIYNSTASPITVNSVSIPFGEGRTCVVLGGQLRGM
jgi:hypothetical protein